VVTLRIKQGPGNDIGEEMLTGAKNSRMGIPGDPVLWGMNRITWGVVLD
jgi:hypothetical protein